MKKLLLKAKFLLASVFGNADKFLLNHADEAIKYASELRNIVESPVIGYIVKLTPTGIDDAALAVAQKVIDKVFQELQLISACTKLATPEERFSCFVEAAKMLSPAMKEAMYMKFASLFAKIKSGINASQSAFDTAVQARYFETK